jgi:hypothetical protein
MTVILKIGGVAGTAPVRNTAMSYSSVGPRFHLIGSPRSCLFAMVAGVAIAGCHRGELDEPAEALRPAVVVAESGQAVSISPSASDASLAGTLLFTDVTPASGIDFQYYGVPSSEMYMTEQNGGGIALADFKSPLCFTWRVSVYRRDGFIRADCVRVWNGVLCWRLQQRWLC